MTVDGGSVLLAEVSASQRPRILVAEDDPVNQDIALLMLNSLGYEADVVGTGSEALAAARDAFYDVILMDIQMPEMDGLEATQQIRASMPTQLQPAIIAMTANAAKEDEQAYLRVGMDDLLAKPIHIETLTSALAAWTSGGVARRPVAGEPGAGELGGWEPVAGEPGAGELGGWEPVAGEFGGWDGVGESPRSTSGPSPTVDGFPIFDPAVLDSLARDLGDAGDEVREDLIETFLTTSEERLDWIAAAGRDMDGPALAACAHAIKSASASIGLLTLSNTAASIQTALQTLPECLDVAFEATKLTAEYDRAIQALRAASGGTSNGPGFPASPG
jgi:CheY-like chemotaxis protein